MEHSSQKNEDADPTHRSPRKQTLEALETLRPLSGRSEWLFPGNRNPAKPMSNNTILEGLERIGYKGRMTGHGFRGLAATILHEQDYAHEQLAHAPRNAVSAAYNYALHLAPRTKMMADWAEYLECTQRGSKPVSQVIDFEMSSRTIESRLVS